PPLPRRAPADPGEPHGAAARMGRRRRGARGGAREREERVMTEDLPTADPGTDWLDRSCAAITAEPDDVTRAFALAARRVGRGPQCPDVDPTGVVHGAVDDAARARLVVALADAVGTGLDLA